jgi:hypothetical protein
MAIQDFLGKIHTEAKADVLGGSDELVLGMAKLLERMGMMERREKEDSADRSPQPPPTQETASRCARTLRD